MIRNITFALLALFLPGLVNAQVSDNGKPVKVITNADIGTVNDWSADTVYNLSGFCVVENGEVLNIAPGTIIKGNPGQGANATALIVARGGTLNAIGRCNKPIIFTSIQDDLDNPLDIPLDQSGRGLWGGLIILGFAGINTTAGQGQIEGLPDLGENSSYGGSDDNDSSGKLKYISIRHGGSEIGAANEINGLTMGAVGRGTEISHIEVLFNLDDGYEWFGGTVNADHLISAFCSDDGFDYDEGWRGSGQYWFAIQSSDAGDRGGEHDGGTTPVDGTPYATPLISNATYIGRGSATGIQRCFEIRDNAGSAYYNSIFTEHGTYGVKIEQVDPLIEPTDSEDRLAAGHIKFFNNIWWDFGNGNSSNAVSNGVSYVESAIFTSGNDFIYNPILSGVSRTPIGTLDPRPTDLSGWTRGWIDPLGVDGFAPTGANINISWPAFITQPFNEYPGAFDPDIPIKQSWIGNWTALDFYGYLGSATVVCCKLRGDVNHSGSMDISDLTAMVSFLFGGACTPSCLDELDVNGGGSVDVSDLTFTVNHLFRGGQAPAPCL